MEAEGEVEHMVIGHSQVRGLSAFHFEEDPDINFHITWESVSGGKAPQLATLIKETIQNSSSPLRISAIIWQNSIWNISLKEVEDIVLDMESFLQNYPSHRVAFPECQYVPEQHLHWEKIARINEILKSYNLRQGFNRYPLFKATMQNQKNQKGLGVRQSKWKEHNNRTGLGYHIDPEKGQRNFAKFIRRFHANGFNDNKTTSASSVNKESNDRGVVEKESSKILFVRTPGTELKTPEQSDARLIINQIRAGNQQHTEANITENLEVPEQSNKGEKEKGTTTKTLSEWMKEGENSGFLDKIANALNKSALKRKEMKKKKREEEKRKKREEEKRKKRKEEERKKRKRKEEKRMRKKKMRRDSSSSSSSNSSSSSSSSSSESSDSSSERE